MTPVEEALNRVITVLDDIGVPYMVTGSVAASFHGWADGLGVLDLWLRIAAPGDSTPGKTS